MVETGILVRGLPNMLLRLIKLPQKLMGINAVPRQKLTKSSRQCTQKKGLQAYI
jgi:hypothetical protein